MWKAWLWSINGTLPPVIEAVATAIWECTFQCLQKFRVYLLALSASAAVREHNPHF